MEVVAGGAVSTAVIDVGGGSADSVLADEHPASAATASQAVAANRIVGRRLGATLRTVLLTPVRVSAVTHPYTARVPAPKSPCLTFASTVEDSRVFSERIRPLERADRDRVGRKSGRVDRRVQISDGSVVR